MSDDRDRVTAILTLADKLPETMWFSELDEVCTSVRWLGPALLEALDTIDRLEALVAAKERVTQRILHEQMPEREPRRRRCPVHGIPDCSPLLNGCIRLNGGNVSGEGSQQ